VRTLRPDIAKRLTLSFGFYYLAMFVVIGVQLPYWPVWLKDKGMTAAEIGILVATLLWVKVAFNPIAGHLVDVTGKRRPILMGLSVGALIAYCGFLLVDGFWGLLGLSIVSGAFFAALLPISDNLTMTYVIRYNLDYGRIRLWGSLSFIAASAAVGRILDLYPSGMIIWLIIFAMIPFCLLALQLPDTPKHHIKEDTKLGWGDLLRERIFWVFMAATSLTGASHATYYGFATLHWYNSGIDHTWIGILWGIGVAAEVILFAFSREVVRRVGPYNLLILGGLGGVIRWTILASQTDLWLLMPAQCLHGLTFGALHLGAMHFIARNITPSITGRAQGLYAAMGNGVVLGFLTILAGWLFANFGGKAFYAMSICSLIGMIAAIALPRIVRKAKGSRVFRESL